MADRRPLIDGLKPPPAPIDRAVETAFVFGPKTTPPVVEEPAPVPPTPPPVSRSPLTTRIRADYAAALKRASLERQLSGTTPHTLQELLEEALEPWLKAHGYVP